MKNATPKYGIRLPPPKNKEERLIALSKLNELTVDKNVLEKAFLFLPQLKKAGIGKYNTKENEIRGLTNDDVSTVYHLLNSIYLESESDEGYNVFSITGEPYITEEGYYERTFMPGQKFELALSEVKEVLDGKDNYLVLKNDIFFYNGSKLKISSDTLLYKILRTIYDYFGGRGGERQYKDVLEELRTIKELKHKSNDDLRLKIRQNLTSNKMGLGEKISAVEKNGKKLFETQGGKKFVFNNQKVSG